MFKCQLYENYDLQVHYRLFQIYYNFTHNCILIILHGAFCIMENFLIMNIVVPWKRTTSEDEIQKCHHLCHCRSKFTKNHSDTVEGSNILFEILNIKRSNGTLRKIIQLIFTQLIMPELCFIYSSVLCRITPASLTQAWLHSQLDSSQLSYLSILKPSRLIQLHMCLNICQVKQQNE